MEQATSQKIAVFVNGKAQQVALLTSIGALVRELRLEPKGILVELNGEAMLSKEWPTHILEHGDRLELIRVVAGG